MTTDLGVRLEPHSKPRGRHCTHRKYLMTCDQYEQMRAEAQDCCQICGITGLETPHGFLVIDHDAYVGNWAVRGLLCSNCNTKLPASATPDDPRFQRHVADPWYLRMLASLGLGPDVPVEPPVGSIIQCGRRRWIHEPGGWRATDRYGITQETWSHLCWRFGPHNCHIIEEKKP